MRRFPDQCRIAVCEPTRAHVRAQAEPPVNLRVVSFYAGRLPVTLFLGTMSEIQPPVSTASPAESGEITSIKCQDILMKNLAFYSNNLQFKF